MIWPFRKKKVFYTHTPQFYKTGQQLMDGKVLSVTMAYWVSTLNGPAPCFRVVVKLDRKKK
jgi:hypothetical protein